MSKMFKAELQPIFNFIQIGAGGTGSFLYPNLLRLLKYTKDKHEIILIDGDSTEEKNLNRQNFAPDELGVNKAASLFKRYYKTINYEKALFAPKYLDDSKSLLKLIDNSTAIPVVLGVVDNNDTRHLIKEAIAQTNRPIIWFDSGNSQRSGQVISSSKNMKNSQWLDTLIADDKDTKDGIDLFPEAFAKDGQHPDSLSCAEHAVESIQDIAANITAATVMFDLIAKLVSHQIVPEGVIKFDTSTITVNQNK